MVLFPSPSTGGNTSDPVTSAPGEAPGPSSFMPMTFPPPSTRKTGKPVLNKFVLYETKTRYYVVGTNAPSATRFRVLKIDRTTAPDELSITEDRAVYSKTEIDDLLAMIRNGNKATGGLKEVIKFYGIIGFVRFTEGYYISLVTKRSPVALIGGHYVFHIDATTLISIHPTTTPAAKLDKNSDEARYMQIFQMVDLSKNFYFSYSYDITRTLQWNMTRSRFEGRNQMFVWNQYLLENGFKDMKGIESQWALPIMYGFVDQSKISILGRNVFVTLIARRSRHFAGARFLKRGVNDQGYVANDVETEQIVSEMSTTSFYGSGSYAVNPNHTSFVQHRGSIPLYWTQDGTNMTPKPPIALSVVDPYFSAAALHFDDMFKRYGTPCIALNLIKAKEKTARESLLLKEFSECTEYLNHFLPEDKKIQHIKWDMSRASKSHNENVIAVLEIIAEKTFNQTGFFHSGFNQRRQNHWIHQQLYHSIPRTPGDPDTNGNNGRTNTVDDISPKLRLKFQNTRLNMIHKRREDRNVIFGTGLQNGVVRTNCIDCLDRTNAAQFVIAKHALGYQLYSLGLISEPFVPFDCDVVNMLTEMYHDHGDTIALQYGGSHLVNTMETYRKINQWTSHSRDMIESIRRFYSNSFVDTEKQFAMNLFLGNFVVRKGRPAIWELPSDYHLHNQWPTRATDLSPNATYVPPTQRPRRTYTKWWTPDALLPQDELIKKLAAERRQRQLEAYQLQVQERQHQRFQEQQQRVFEDHKIYRREKAQAEQEEVDHNGDGEQEFMLHDDGYDEHTEPPDYTQDQPSTVSNSNSDQPTMVKEGKTSDDGAIVTPAMSTTGSTNQNLLPTGSNGNTRRKSIAESKLSSFASLKSVSDILESRQQQQQSGGRSGSSNSVHPSNPSQPKDGGAETNGADTTTPEADSKSMAPSVSEGSVNNSANVSTSQYADILGTQSTTLQPAPSSSSSSISSFQLGGGFLHGSKSKSSIGSNSIKAFGVHASKGEELVLRGVNACRDSDDDDSDSDSECDDTSSLSDSSASPQGGSSVHGAKKLSASEFARLELELALESGREVRLDFLGGKKRAGKTVKSALKKEWDEYWDEYYRPNVQTSFQRLFAYTMNSTSRYIPPNIKDASEQSPFEVRLYHHNIPQQTEHK
ncbi:phosphatidylinositol-3,5-bisphosphate 5-phosphatase [Actinomortierella wolfii]|nr:phosphatidylinositol-3,5-bisphosphate 5-phosphatase [Actinomortierella wolfii]